MARRAWRGTNRHHQPRDPGTAHRGRAARLARGQERRGLSAPLRARSAWQHLRHRPANHGLRRRRARTRPQSHPGQRRLAGTSPDQAGRPGLLARLVDLFQLQAHPARRQFQHPVRLARPARRRRGGRAGQARGLGPGANLLGTQPETRRQLGLHPRFRRFHGQHDLRGHLEPGHHRAASGSRDRSSSRETPFRTAARGESIPACSVASTGWPITSRSARTTATVSNGSSTISTAWNVPAGWEACGSSAGTTGIAWVPKSSSTSKTSSRASGKAPGRERQDGRHQLRALVSGQGPCTGAGQQAAAWPAGRLEQRRRRRAQHRLGRLPRLEEPAHLAGGRPRLPPTSPTCSRHPSSSSTATRPPSSMPSPSRTCASSSRKGASSSPTPAAPAPPSTPASRTS